MTSKYIFQNKIKLRLQSSWIWFKNTSYSSLDLIRKKVNLNFYSIHLSSTCINVFNYYVCFSILSWIRRKHVHYKYIDRDVQTCVFWNCYMRVELFATLCIEFCYNSYTNFHFFLYFCLFPFSINKKVYNKHTLLTLSKDSSFYCYPKCVQNKKRENEW